MSKVFARLDRDVTEELNSLRRKNLVHGHRQPNFGRFILTNVRLHHVKAAAHTVRIYDRDTKRVLQNVTLFLTPKEADELGQSASDLAKHPEKHHHHVSDADFKRGITVAVYTAENASAFDAESRKVIDAA